MADPPNIGDFGLGTRNNRGQIMLNFLNKEQMYCMNTFFEKTPQRKWTWRNPDDAVKNEIDYVFTTDKHICIDVSVLNRFSTESDHRSVININIRLEKKKQIEKKLYPTMKEFSKRRNVYNIQLDKKLEPIEDLGILELNAMAKKKFQQHKSGNQESKLLRVQSNTKFSPETTGLLKKRRTMDRNSGTRDTEN